MKSFIPVAFFIITMLLFTYIMMVHIERWPKNPIKWLEIPNKRRERRRIERISVIEHELGYRPCSDDHCWSCSYDLKYGKIEK